MGKRSERRRARRRLIERVTALHAAEVFEQRALARHREGERLVCLACAGTVKPVKGLKGVAELRCKRCGRRTTQDAFQEAMRELERAGQRAAGGADPNGAPAAPGEERRIILTDDLQPPPGAAGLYVSGDLVGA